MASAHPLSDRPWLTAYADGVPATIGDVRQTLTEMLDATADDFGDRVALDFFGATTTYRQLHVQVERVARGLHDRGVRAGDRVAIVLPNCPQHVVAFYAVLRLGAIVVEHNPLYTADELDHQFADHGADHAIVWDHAVDRVAGLPEPHRPAHIVSVDLTEAMPTVKRLALRLPIARAREARAKLTHRPSAAGFIRWRRLVRSAVLSEDHPRPEINDIALLQYTSGTTGQPKGAILTHRNLRANALQGRAWVPGLTEGEETFYAVLPLFHAYGMTLCLSFAMSIGATLVLFPTFDTGLVADAAKTRPPTFLPAVPPVYDQLSRSAAQGAIDLRGVRFAISGAMSLPEKTVSQWEKATGGLLVEGYGMTETSPVALGNPMGASRRVGTVGVPFPDTEIRVVDPEDPELDLPIGEQGELLIRGPQVFEGYWRRPDETAATLREGGWIRTGDVVTVSPDGFVTIVDRLKEIIITGGFNVTPSEVEAVLRRHPDVADAAVVALPRPQGGESVGAAVVVREGATYDVKSLRAFCREHLADYKVPRRFAEFEDLPRSLVGKTLRRQVRDQLIAAV